MCFVDFETIAVIFHKLKRLYDRILQTQANIAGLLEEIELWGYEPLFIRKDGNKKGLLQTDDRAERVQRRYDIIVTTSKRAQEAIKENYRLFFNIPEVDEEEEEEEVSLFRCKNN